MQRLAIYDLDRTVTRLPTWTPFLLSAARQAAPWRLGLVPVAALAGAAHKAGLIGRDRIKEIMHALMLGRTIPPHRLAPLVDGFVERTVAGNIRPGARTRMEADRRAGYRVVLATAANRFYAEALAERLDIADVVATESLSAGSGDVRNRLNGANVYGPAKRAAVEAWMRGEDLERGDVHIRFYSDHASDAPMFALADEPFAVNPHGALRRLAQANGWPILDWNADAPRPVDGEKT